MKHLLLLLCAICLSCNPTTSPNVPAGPLSFFVDGVAWSASQPTVLTNKQVGTINISATSSDGSSAQLIVSVQPYRWTNGSAFSDTSALPTPSYFEFIRNGVFYLGGHGSVVLTSLGGAHAKGTFTAVCSSASATTKITGGQFDVPY